MGDIILNIFQKTIITCTYKCCCTLGEYDVAFAWLVGITQPDLCEMEIKEPYGRIDKYQRLSDYLSIPVNALVTNDCAHHPAFVL